MFVGLWNEQINFNLPQLSNALWLGPGQFRARVYGVSGTTNVIEASSDLNSWAPVFTNNNGGVYDFNDTSAGSFTDRFYRAKLYP